MTLQLFLLRIEPDLNTVVNNLIGLFGELSKQREASQGKDAAGAPKANGEAARYLHARSLSDQQAESRRQPAGAGSRKQSAERSRPVPTVNTRFVKCPVTQTCHIWFVARFLNR